MVTTSKQGIYHYIPHWSPLILHISIIYIYWLVVFRHPSEKYDFVSWDDYSIPNCFWKVIQNSMVPVTTNQDLNGIFNGFSGIKKKKHTTFSWDQIWDSPAEMLNFTANFPMVFTNFGLLHMNKLLSFTRKKIDNKIHQNSPKLTKIKK